MFPSGQLSKQILHTAVQVSYKPEVLLLVNYWTCKGWLGRIILAEILL